MFKFKGKIYRILPTEEIGDKGFAKRVAVVVDDVDSEYPVYAAFEAKRTQKKDRTKILDRFREGDPVEVSFAVESRSWTDSNKRIRWFSSLVLTDIEGDKAYPLASEPAEPSVPESQDDAQDLPF